MENVMLLVDFGVVRYFIASLSVSVHVRIQRGGGGPDPSQHSLLSQHRHASEMPFKWRFAGGPLIARIVVFGSFLSSSNLKKKRCLSLTPSDKTFWSML